MLVTYNNFKMYNLGIIKMIILFVIINSFNEPNFNVDKMFYSELSLIQLE